MLTLLAFLGSLWMAVACDTGFCSCAGPQTTADAFRGADAVFTGRVIAMREATADGWRQRVVTLRVDRSWKGVETDTVVVTTGSGGGDCGFPFVDGGEYLLYAHGQPPRSLSVSICGRSTAVERADEDLRALGNPAQTWSEPLEPECDTDGCDCTPPATASAARDHASAVFAGTVVGIRDTVVSFEGEENSMYAVTMRVDRAWKGLTEERVTVLTGWASTCGFAFQSGESYLVYAESWVAAGGRLITGSCERTAPLSRAREDLRELGAPAWTRPASNERR